MTSLLKASPYIDYHLYRMYDSAATNVPGTQQRTGYANPEVDKLLDQERSTFDQAKRLPILKQAQALVWQDQPLIYLLQMVNLWGSRNGTSGYHRAAHRRLRARPARAPVTDARRSAACCATSRGGSCWAVPVLLGRVADRVRYPQDDPGRRGPGRWPGTDATAADIQAIRQSWASTGPCTSSTRGGWDVWPGSTSAGPRSRRRPVSYEIATRVPADRGARRLRAGAGRGGGPR